MTTHQDNGCNRGRLWQVGPASVGDSKHNGNNEIRQQPQYGPAQQQAAPAHLHSIPLFGQVQRKLVEIWNALCLSDSSMST